MVSLKLQYLEEQGVSETNGLVPSNCNEKVNLMISSEDLHPQWPTQPSQFPAQETIGFVGFISFLLRKLLTVRSVKGFPGVRAGGTFPGSCDSTRRRTGFWRRKQQCTGGSFTRETS